MSESNPTITVVKKTLTRLGVNPQSHILSGVSGGMDSMVMAKILRLLGYEMTVAHVNFQLRGSESEEDESFVREWCLEENISFITLKQNANIYSLEKKLNTQTAARDIRYNWWDELLERGTYDFVATGHHRDDVIETFFLNALRGSGIKGLTGIPAKRGKFIRPLIEVSRADIQMFAEENLIPFREDSSNEKDTYRRNQIRHHLIPVIRKILPEQDLILSQTLRRIGIEWESWNALYKKWQEKNITNDNDHFLIKASANENAFVLKWLEEKNIPWQLGYDFVFASGEINTPLEYDGYRLSRSKEGFYFEKITPSEEIIIPNMGLFSFNEFQFKIELVSSKEFFLSSDAGIQFINKDTIQWPLTIRPVEQGDSFQPFGMGGQNKKLQDYLVDLKLDFHEKKAIKVLESNGRIIWIMGRRLDERSRVKENDEEIYRVEFRSVSRKQPQMK